MDDIDKLRLSLRAGILGMQESCLAEIRTVIAGKKAISDVTKEASKMIQRMLRVDQETRMERENAASLSLRYIKILDDNDEARKSYIKKTAPHLPAPVKGLPAPEKKKKK